MASQWGDRGFHATIDADPALAVGVPQREGHLARDYGYGGSGSGPQARRVR